MKDAEKRVPSTHPDDDLNHAISAITEDADGFINWTKLSIDAVGAADGLVNENDSDVIVPDITSGSVSILQHDLKYT